jgi:Domain of unknown function (DU1801)
VETVPAEAFLAAYPPAIGRTADLLRSVVRLAVPDAVERVRPGWRLIGYDVPVGRRSVYFAYVAPEPEHVHLGFEYSAWMTDPDGLLEGAHLGLRRVRYTTFREEGDLPIDRLVELTREAARVAALPPAARETLG